MKKNVFLLTLILSFVRCSFGDGDDHIENSRLLWNISFSNVILHDGKDDG